MSDNSNSIQPVDPSSINFLEEIADFTFTSKYARYNEKEGRRETWNETVDRVEAMHLKRFSWMPASDLVEIKWAFQKVREKVVVPSLRSLQFGGKAIEKNHTKMYNCAVRHIDSVRAFSEVFFLLLSGAGVGLGLQKKYINRLPNLVSAEDKTGTVLTYVIEDTIEGWADSIEVMLMSYFKGTAFTGRKVVHDYSKIRKKGAPLKTSGGKAPGYHGLKAAHGKIKQLLDRIIEEHGQKRLKTVNVLDIICHTADAVLSGGVRRSAMIALFDHNDNDMMAAKTYFKVDRYKMFVKDEETGNYHGQVIIGKHNKSVEISEFDYNILTKEKKISWFYIEPQRARSNNSVALERENATLEQFKDIISKTREFGEPGFVFVNASGTMVNPCFTPDTQILTSEGYKKIVDLVGRTDVTILQDPRVIGYVKDGMEKWDIMSTKEMALDRNRAFNIRKTAENQDVYTLKTNDKSVTATANHHFATLSGMKELKDIQIGEVLLTIDSNNYPSFDTVQSITYSGKSDVYCLTEDNRRALIANGFTARRCGEIGFVPVTSDGISGVQVCNLTSINGGKITSAEKFKEAARAATIIGTLQADYTEFPYLSKAAKELTEEESLLGVSITGFMDNPEVLLNYALQKEVAEYAVKVNEEWAKKIGIASASRVTTCKPEGSSSIVLSTGSGIHPHHARRYFRRIQCNTEDNVYKYFKSVNPHAIEASVWSASKTDDVVTFPLTVSDKAIVKADLTALKHLEIIKNTQQNWVLGGNGNNKKDVTHNVSCTVLVKDDEWDSVIQYIYDNRYAFSAVSLLPNLGDKLYKQAPMEAITTPEDEQKWQQLVTSWKKLDFTQLKEGDDETKPQQEVACAGGACEAR
jgi:ribonucleotide reductase alpha subunit